MPLNLASEGATVDQIVTGSWSKKAAEEAAKYASVNIVAKGDNQSIPPPNQWRLTPGAAYVHYCDNETIQVWRAFALKQALRCFRKYCMNLYRIAWGDVEFQDMICALLKSPDDSVLKC